MPRLSVCADAQKVDRAKLAQTEVSETPTINVYLATEKIDEREFLYRKFTSSREIKIYWDIFINLKVTLKLNNCNILYYIL